MEHEKTDVSSIISIIIVQNEFVIARKLNEERLKYVNKFHIIWQARITESRNRGSFESRGFYEDEVNGYLIERSFIR